MRIRTIYNNPTAILCSDFHLREDTPEGRTDNYWEAQWRKIDFISNLQKKYNCIVLCAGDLFNHWKPSPNLLSVTSQHIPNNFITVYGQHDLPQHSLELDHKCGIWNLMINSRLTILEQGYWGWKPSGGKGFIFNNNEICVWHIMNYKGNPPWPGCTDPTALKLLKKYPQYNLIVTGDNHKTFTQEYNGRWLVNPGSLMRMKADQINHSPSVFLWYASTNKIEQIFLPIEDGVISREHIKNKKERDSRIDAFVSKLNTDYETELSYEDNLENFFKNNNVRKEVKEIIYKSVDEPSRIT